MEMEIRRYIDKYKHRIERICRYFRIDYEELIKELASNRELFRYMYYWGFNVSLLDRENIKRLMR